MPAARRHPLHKPWKPGAPQASAYQAVTVLLNAWAAHSRPEALRDASPAAVASLFAHPYPSGGPQFRGCSTPPANEPATCSMRVGDGLLNLTAKPFPPPPSPRGWAVTAAVFES